MFISEKLKVGGHRVGVSFHTSKSMDNEGDYNHYHRHIRLRKDPEISQDTIDEAFQHEIFECIDKLNNLQIGHTALTVLSEVFFQVVRDNNLDFRDGRGMGMKANELKIYYRVEEEVDIVWTPLS